MEIAAASSIRRDFFEATKSRKGKLRVLHSLTVNFDPEADVHTAGEAYVVCSEDTARDIAQRFALPVSGGAPIHDYVDCTLFFWTVSLRRPAGIRII